MKRGVGRFPDELLQIGILVFDRIQVNYIRVVDLALEPRLDGIGLGNAASLLEDLMKRCISFSAVR
jgi:hypothetical protein